MHIYVSPIFFSPLLLFHSVRIYNSITTLFPISIRYYLKTSFNNSQLSPLLTT
ncbi:hypothetical protein Hanom_Chr01g00078481 [Helianthus anomalus]